MPRSQSKLRMPPPKYKRPTPPPKSKPLVSLSQFDRLSKELLLAVATTLSACTFLGPPTDLLSFMLISKTVYSTIPWSSVFVEVFYDKFDISAPVRRLGAKCKNPDVLKQELVSRFEMLKRFRFGYYVQNGSIHLCRDTFESLRQDLWKATLMFMECDGNNLRQLVDYAKVDVFALRYISWDGPLCLSAFTNSGWVVDDEVNSLAVGIFSYTDTVRSETRGDLIRVLRAMGQPFADSRYMCTLEPIIVASNPLTTTLRNFTLSRTRTLASHLLDRTRLIRNHFGTELRLALPRMAESASICISRRLRRLKMEGATNHLFAGGTLRPENVRYLLAVAKEVSGTVDWNETASAPGMMKSKHFDHDWARLHQCYFPHQQSEIRNRVLTPGMLHGKWRGYFFDTTFEEVAVLHRRGRQTVAICDRTIHPTLVEFEVREYHQHHKRGVFPFHDVTCGPSGLGGILNAWFPSETTVTEGETRLAKTLEVAVNYDPKRTSLYQRYDPASNSPHDRDPEAPYGNGVWDIILLGRETGAPAGSPTYFGRVRSWDGLVVMVYGDINMDLQKKRICFGYISGSHNLIGKWRSCATPLDERGSPSGAWTMARCL